MSTGQGDWKCVELHEVGKVVTGSTPPKAREDYYGGSFPFVKPGELLHCTVSDSVDRLSEAGSKVADVAPAGGVLVSCIGNLGKTGLATRPVAFNQQINAIIPHVPEHSKWVFYAVQTPDFASQLAAVSSATTIAIVNKGKFSALRIPLAPDDDQPGIVAEIEKQFTRLEAGVTALRRVQTNLKRYRAAVLKAACEGRLVPTEAEWKQVRLEDLIGKISQGWSPKCDLTRDALPNEWAIVTTTAVQAMRYIDNQGKPLPSAFKPRPHIEIQAGDFLMTRKGPRKRAGVACLVRFTRSRLMVCDTVYRFRCHESRVVPGYLELALNSPSVVEAIDRQKAGINESGVSLTHDKLGGVLIPMPPLGEQTRIVAEVERRLSVVEELETVVSANLQRATRLRQSILHRAFDGKLPSET